MEATIFENKPVRPGTLATKILSHKGSIFSNRGSTAVSSDAHRLVLSLWVVNIIRFHWSDKLEKKQGRKINGIVCSVSKKSGASNSYRMNHRYNNY